MPHESRVRRCHISCRIPSTSILDRIINCHKITSARGTAYTINGIIAAYNDQTKEAYFYLENQRVDKKHIDEHMIRLGAKTVRVDPVSQKDWEADSRKAIQSVIEYGERSGFVAAQYGVLGVDTRGASTGGFGGASTGDSGGIETESDDEEEEHAQCPRPSGSDRERTQERGKRRRSTSPHHGKTPPAGTGGNDAGGGRGGGMDALAVDFMRGVMQDATRRTDAMLELQGTVTSFKFEKRISELVGTMAGLHNELSEKKAEIERLMAEGAKLQAKDEECASKLRDLTSALRVSEEKHTAAANAARQAEFNRSAAMDAMMKSYSENAQRGADDQLKALDKAHAAAMGGLRGELYGKYEEERLKALDEAAARGKVEEEKSKLETDLQELGLSRVI